MRVSRLIAEAIAKVGLPDDALVLVATVQGAPDQRLLAVVNPALLTGMGLADASGLAGGALLDALDEAIEAVRVGRDRRRARPDAARTIADEVLAAAEAGRAEAVFGAWSGRGFARLRANGAEMTFLPIHRHLLVVAPEYC